MKSSSLARVVNNTTRKAIIALSIIGQAQMVTPKKLVNDRTSVRFFGLAEIGHFGDFGGSAEQRPTDRTEPNSTKMRKFNNGILTIQKKLKKFLK